MLRLLRLLVNKNVSGKRDSSIHPAQLGKEAEVVTICKQDCREKFAEHIGRYIGQTVTVFVNAGGNAGMGFTGILISANCEYIRIITRIGLAPACPLNNRHITQRRFFNVLGSTAIIPVSRIASFVHSTL